MRRGASLCSSDNNVELVTTVLGRRRRGRSRQRADGRQACWAVPNCQGGAAAAEAAAAASCSTRPGRGDEGKTEEFTDHGGTHGSAAPRRGRGSFERRAGPKTVAVAAGSVRIRTMVGERAGVPLAGWHTRPGKRVRPPLARLRGLTVGSGLWRRGPPRRAVRQPRCRCHARSSALQTHERRDGERALAHSLARRNTRNDKVRGRRESTRGEVRRAREGKKRAAKWEEDITISESLAVLMVFCTTACLRMMGLYHIHFGWTVSVG